MLAAMEEHDLTAALFDSLGGADMAPEEAHGAAKGAPTASPEPENDAMGTVSGEAPIDWDEMETAGPGVSIHVNELEGTFMALDEDGKEVEAAVETQSYSRPGSRAGAPDRDIEDEEPERPSSDGQATVYEEKSCPEVTVSETSTALGACGGVAPEEPPAAEAPKEEEANTGVATAGMRAVGVLSLGRGDEDVTAALFDSLEGGDRIPADAGTAQRTSGANDVKPELGEASEPLPAVAGDDQPAIEETRADKREDSRLCVVCKNDPGKYKCTLCSAPFCSVACNRKHKENHPPVPEKTAGSPPAPKPKRKWEDDDPYGVLLEHLDELQRLFRKYPNLENELNQIGKATLPPPNGHLPPRHKTQHGFHKKHRPWTKEDGLRKGAAALRKARTDPSEKGDAVREYCELVLHLLSKPGDSKATRLVREAVVAGDAKVIQQLMQDEQDKD